MSETDTGAADAGPFAEQQRLFSCCPRIRAISSSRSCWAIPPI
ncbi:hypothetical protein ACFQH8_19805 [Halomicroarcula sp. GCM10025710]